MAYSSEQLTAGVADGLRRPVALQVQRHWMASEIVTDTEGRATQRLARGVAGWL